MKSKLIKFFYFLPIILFVACSKPQPQKPVSSSQDAMQLRDSIAKQEFELDKKIILEYIERHPNQKFVNYSDGFWLSSEMKSNNAITKNQQITYTYSVTNFEDEEIYSTQDVGNQYAVIGKTRQIKGINEAFQHLSEGEKATLLIPSYMAYGFSGDGKKILPAQPIVVHLEILELKSIP